MDRRLINYLPPVLREVLEFQEINEACEPEIAIAWDALALVMANQFLDTATEHGVSVWEEELGIYPKDTDTMAMRKARIKAMWNLELPYTLPWLRNWITNLCGPDGYEVGVSEYTIDIQLDYTVLPDSDALAAEILDMLLMIRPANMHLLMTAFLQSYGTLNHSAYTETANCFEIWPRLVNELESTGNALTAGALEQTSCIEIYPTEQEEQYV